MTRLTSLPAPTEGYRHAALFYAGRDEFVRRNVPFLRAGAARREPTLVVVDRDKIDALRSALGRDADAVMFEDMSDIGSNPARIIPAWQDFVAAHPGRSLRGIGEPIYPERSPAELVECQHHERLLNVALDDSRLFLVCPYDTDAMGPEVLDEARHSHPIVNSDGRERPSEQYAGDDAAGALLGDPLPEPEPEVRPQVLGFARHTLTEIRSAVRDTAATAGLGEERGTDLVLAVQELAANSVRHGGGSGTLRMWAEASEVVCEVRDAGRIDDPLVDRRRPSGDRTGGYGLWLANQLCDLVQLRSGPAGTVARVRMRLTPAPATSVA